MDPSRSNNSQQNQRNDNTNNTNNHDGFLHRLIDNIFHPHGTHLNAANQSALSSSSGDVDNDVIMSGTDSTFPSEDPSASSSHDNVPQYTSSSHTPTSYIPDLSQLNDDPSHPPSRNSTRRARVEDEMDIEDMRETNRQRMHSPPASGQDLPHHFHQNLPHIHHEHPEHPEEPVDGDHTDPAHHDEHDPNHQHHGHGRWVMDQPGGHRVIFDVFVGPPQRGPQLGNMPDGAFVFNLPLGGNAPQGENAAPAGTGNQGNVPNNLLDHIRQQLANPPADLMQMLVGGLNFGGEEPEDPERAKRLVDGLEEVPVGLVKRLQRVGGEDGDGAPNCAVCWESLLDGDGGFDVKEGQERQTEGTQSEAFVASGSGTSEPPSVPLTEERKYPKIVTLPCSHVFHANCLLPWFTRPHRTTCPTCRFDIDPDSLTYVPRRARPRPPRTSQQPQQPNVPVNEQQAQRQQGANPPAANATPQQPHGIGPLPPFFASLINNGANHVVPAPGPEPTPVAIPVTLNPDGPPTVLISGTPQTQIGSNLPSGSQFPGAGPAAGGSPGPSNASNQPLPPAPPAPPAHPHPGPDHGHDQGAGHGNGQGQERDPNSPPPYLTLDISFVVPIAVPVGQAPPGAQQGTPIVIPTNGPANPQPAQPSQPMPTVPPVMGNLNAPPVAPRPLPRVFPPIFGGGFAIPPVGVGHAFGVGLGGIGGHGGMGPGLTGGSGPSMAPVPPPRPASAPATGHSGSRARSQSPLGGFELPPFAIPIIPPQQTSQGTQTQSQGQQPPPPPASQNGQPQQAQGQQGQQAGAPPPANPVQGLMHAFSQALTNAMTDAFAHEALALRLRFDQNRAEHQRQTQAQAQPQPQSQSQPSSHPTDAAQTAPNEQTQAGASDSTEPQLQQQAQQEQPPPTAQTDDEIRDRATQRVFQDLFPNATVPSLERIRQFREAHPARNDAPPLPPFFQLPNDLDLGDQAPPPHPLFGAGGFGFGLGGAGFGLGAGAGGLGGTTRPRSGNAGVDGENAPPKPQWSLPPAPGLTLRERVEKREREMGLRCSDISCGVGPSDDDPEPIIDPRSIKQIGIKKKGANEKDKQEDVCSHKFHAACLVSAERVAGWGGEDKKDERHAKDDEDVEVSCPVCRAVGSISHQDWDDGVRALA